MFSFIWGTYIFKKDNCVWWFMPVIPATSEVKIGSWFEPSLDKSRRA
jgi:hypothetical protein